MKWQNELTDILRIQYPVVQAPMLGVTTPEMVAAISDQGGLGSLPLGGLSPDKTLSLIRRTKELTSKPFAVNLFTYDIPAINVEQASVMQDFLERLCTAHHLTFEKQAIDDFRFYSYLEQIDLVLSENIPIVSFTFGIPDDKIIEAFHSQGVTLIGTATCVREALILDQKGIDMIAVQGIEAGGHRGTFIADEPLPQIGTMSLVPEIARRLSRPVLAAGGIKDGRTVRASFALGAKAVQIGTAFIASHESAAILSYKAALQNASDRDSILTRAFSGRWARGLRNTLMTEVENSGLAIPPYPIQNSLTTLLRAVAQKADNKEFTNLWAGQSASGAETKPVAEIFQRIIRETEELA